MKFPIASLTVLTLASLSCSRAPGPLDIALATDAQSRRSVVRVTGLGTEELAALGAAKLPDASWQSLLRVTVAGGAGAPVAGKYVVLDDAVEFVPAFPFDPGREYAVRFDAGLLPRPRTGQPAVERRVFLPPPAVHVPSTVVTSIYPSSDLWPENTLRFYIHFSAPMSRASSVGVVRVVDDRGQEVPDALLEMGVDLWNEDRTRCTVFFDPGRVKRGIKPNRERGRALQAGRRYAIVVDAAWKDTNGQPLKAGFRRDVTVVPPIERGIRTADWRVSAPAADTRATLTVTFAWPLDHALAWRAIGVEGSDGRRIAGDVNLDANETRWSFTPAEPWRAGGAYRLAIDTVLEDPSGNQVGRAFEVAPLDREARAPLASRVYVAFAIK